MPKIARALMSAADLIEERGWCQGSFDNAAGNLCAAGAIWAVRAKGVDHYDVEGVFKNALGVPIPEWNDAPERTKGEVVAKLREVAASCA